MHEQNNTSSDDVMDFIFAGLIVVTLVALFIWRAAYSAPSTNVPEIPPRAQYGCAWIDCRPDDKGKMICEGTKYGTHLELVKAIQENNHGAISYDCGPGKGGGK